MMRLVPISLFVLSGLLAAQTSDPPAAPAKDGLMSASPTPAAMPPAGQPSPVQPSGSIQPVIPNAQPVPLGKPDPLLDLPQLPPGAKVSLLGGTVGKLSHVENQVVVQAFGGQQRRVAFDVRTHFYLDDKPATSRDLKAGQRVYVDTMLDGTTVFAKTIWIRTAAVSGEGRGQILSYDASRGLLEVRDELTSQAATLHIGPSTVVRLGDKTGSLADLRAGSIVTLNFAPGSSGKSEVREISILAAPGAKFVFYGRITYLDLSQNMIAINNQSDDRTYELYLQGLPTGQFRNLKQGSLASIQAEFDGTHYVARTLQVMTNQAPQ